MAYSLHLSTAFLASANYAGITGTPNPVLELFGIFVIFCCVLYLAYVASKYVGKKFSAAGQSRYIKVMDRVSLGLDKHLVLVKVGTGYYLFLSGRKDFKMVAKVDIESENAAEPEKNGNGNNEPVFDFREIFDRYANRDRKKTLKSRKNNSEEDVEEISELKENIERLKKMQEKSSDKEV